jgi:SAM-dependent methyltransferase
MQARARRWLRGAWTARVTGDAGRLPVADDNIDLIFSNLMLHWHPEPHAVFPEWKRVLKTDGLLMFSCFGPDTLKEVRAAAAVALPDSRAMPFVDMHDFGDMMVASGFANPVMDAEIITLTYASASELLREVRALGGNPRDDRAQSLPSGRQAREMLKALEAQRGDDGRIRLTFEVAYGHAWKPAPAKAAPPSDKLIPLGTTKTALDAHVHVMWPVAISRAPSRETTLAALRLRTGPSLEGSRCVPAAGHTTCFAPLRQGTDAICGL